MQPARNTFENLLIQSDSETSSKLLEEDEHEHDNKEKEKIRELEREHACESITNEAKNCINDAAESVSENINIVQEEVHEPENSSSGNVEEVNVDGNDNNVQLSVNVNVLPEISNNDLNGINEKEIDELKEECLCLSDTQHFNKESKLIEMPCEKENSENINTENVNRSIFKTNVDSSSIYNKNINNSNNSNYGSTNDRNIISYWDHRVTNLFEPQDHKLTFANDNYSDMNYTEGNQKYNKYNNDSNKENYLKESSMFKQHGKDNHSINCNDSTALANALTNTVANGIRKDNFNIASNENYNIYERGLLALRSKEEKCLLLKKKIEEKRKAFFTFKPTINPRNITEQGSKNNSEEQEIAEECKKEELKKNIVYCVNSCNIHDWSKTSQWRRRMQVLSMPVDETTTHTPRISARSKEIVKQQRANDNQYSLPPHERLYKFEQKSKYTIENVKQNDKNGTKIAGTPSQKHCKRTIKEIREHVNSLFEFERRKQESLSQIRKLSAAQESNNHNIAKEIATPCTSASIKSIMRNALIEKEALQLPNSLYVDIEEVTNRLYKPKNCVCSTLHRKENVEVTAFNKCNCTKENVEPNTRTSTIRNVENKIQEGEIQTNIEGESKSGKQHLERLANRSRMRHLLNWFMYFAKKDVLNLDTLKEYEGEYKNVATCLTKELEKIDSSCIDWTRDSFVHSICSNKHSIAFTALLTGTAPKHDKASYDNDDGDGDHDHHDEDKNEMKKNRTININRSTEFSSMQGVEKRADCLSTKNKWELQENITNFMTTTRSNNNNLKIEPLALHQSQVNTVTDDATQDDEANVKKYLTRGRRVDDNIFTRLYCKARETQLIKQLRALEEQRLNLRREQRRVESNSHWLEEYRKRSLLVNNATVSSAQIDIINKMESRQNEESRLECVNVSEKDNKKDKITCMGSDTSMEEQIINCENVEFDKTNVTDKHEVTMSEPENNFYVNSADAKNSESSSLFNSFSYISNSAGSKEDRSEEIESDQNDITNERALEQNSEWMQNECITGNHLADTNTNNTQNNDTLTSAMFRLEEILTNNNKENEPKCIVEVNNNELHEKDEECNTKNNDNDDDNNDDNNNNNKCLLSVEKPNNINFEEEKWCKKQSPYRTSEVSFMQSEKLEDCGYAQKEMEEPIVYFDLLLDCATCTDLNKINSTQHRYVSERNKAKLHKLALEYYNQLTKKIKS